LERPHLAVLLWGTWLLTAGGFFSTARFFHTYYLVMLAPPIAALAGIGLMTLWNDYRESLTEAGRWWQGWLLPSTVLITALVQRRFLADYADWNGWLAPVIIGGAVLVALVFLAGRLRIHVLVSPDLLLSLGARPALLVAGLGVMTVSIAPATWAVVSVADGNGGAWLPQAGPDNGFGGPGVRFSGLSSPPGGQSFGPPTVRTNARPPGMAALPGRSFGGKALAATPGNGIVRFRAGPFGPGEAGPGAGPGLIGGGALTFAGSDVPTLDRGLLRYLEKHRGGARYLVATTTSSYASLIILDTGQPVMTLGGYQGWDRILTPAQLARLVKQGVIRYFLLPTTSAGSTGKLPPGVTLLARGPGGPISGAMSRLDSINDDLVTWVKTHCSTVPAGAYQTRSTASPAGRQTFGGPAMGPGTLYDCARADL
jgi:4-amino-4-deoxy-L-arabinose transferase-like glycosyltransferase